MCKRSFFQVGLAYGYGLQIVDAAADIRELDVGDIDDMESDVPPMFLDEMKRLKNPKNQG